MNSYSNRTVFWFFMVIAFAVFFYLRDSGLLRGKPAPETWDLVQLKQWQCRLRKPAACTFRQAGLRFSLQNAPGKSGYLALDVGVPEKLGIQEIRLRLMTDLRKNPEREFFVKKVSPGKWRLLLPQPVFMQSPKKSLVIWLLKKPRIVQTILVRQI